jgi:hypothetical protein
MVTRKIHVACRAWLDNRNTEKLCKLDQPLHRGNTASALLRDDEASLRSKCCRLGGQSCARAFGDFPGRYVTARIDT